MEEYQAAYGVRGMLEAGSKGSQVASAVAKASAEEQHGQGDAALLPGRGTATGTAATGYRILLRRCHGCTLLVAPRHWTSDATTAGLNPNCLLLCVTCLLYTSDAADECVNV